MCAGHKALLLVIQSRIWGVISAELAREFGRRGSGVTVGEKESRSRASRNVHEDEAGVETTRGFCHKLWPKFLRA